MPKVAQGQLYGSPGKTKAASAIAAPKLSPANPAAGKPAAPVPAVSSGAGASYAAAKKTAKTPTPTPAPAPVQPPSVPRNYTSNTTLSPVTAPAPAPAQNPAQAPAMNSGLGAAKLPRQSDAAHITAEQQKRQNNGLAVTARQQAASRNAGNQNDWDAQYIMGTGPAFTYTGDPEDVARQMWAESGVTNAAEFRDAEEYFGRSIVGGTLDTLRDTANDISRRSQLSIPEQQAENAYWGAVAGDRGEMDKVYREYLSSLSPDERDALEITGQLMSPEAVYYLHVNQREQEKHKNDRLVNAVDWGIRYNQETQRIAEEKGLSEKTLQEGNFYRSFGRSLPAAALSLASGAGAGLVSAEAANLIMGASRVLSGSLTFHSAAGSAYEDALARGADPVSAMNYATATGAVELATESFVGGMGRLGGRTLGLGAAGSGIADDLARRITKDPIAQEMVLSICNLLGEGAEGFLSEVGGYFADRLFLKLDQRTFGQVLRDAGDAILPSIMSSVLFEGFTLLLEGTDARSAARTAAELVLEDFEQRAGLSDDDPAARTDAGRSEQGEPRPSRSAEDVLYAEGPYSPETGKFSGEAGSGEAASHSRESGNTSAGAARGPIPDDSPSMVFYDLQTIRQFDRMDTVGGGTGLLNRKPPYSPALRRWFNQGGTVEIRVENGHDIWTYTAPGGERCSYVDGNIRFSREHMYSDVSEINIGSFTTRAADRKKAMHVLMEKYNIEKVPDGYILHHDVTNGLIQLVQKDIHSMFTHRGGFSIYVTNGGR